MKTYNKFLISLAVTYGLSNTGLAMAGQSELEIYFIVDAIAFLVMALMFNFNPKAMSVLRTIGTVIFVGFLFLVTVKIIEML